MGYKKNYVVIHPVINNPCPRKQPRRSIEYVISKLILDPTSLVLNKQDDLLKNKHHLHRAKDASLRRISLSASLKQQEEKGKKKETLSRLHLPSMPSRKPLEEVAARLRGQTWQFRSTHIAVPVSITS